VEVGGKRNYKPPQLRPFRMPLTAISEPHTPEEAAPPPHGAPFRAARFPSIWVGGVGNGGAPERDCGGVTWTKRSLDPVKPGICGRWGRDLDSAARHGKGRTGGRHLGGMINDRVIISNPWAEANRRLGNHKFLGRWPVGGDFLSTYLPSFLNIIERNSVNRATLRGRMTKAVDRQIMHDLDFIS
jgi:hypothetical protein